MIDKLIVTPEGIYEENYTEDEIKQRKQLKIEEEQTRIIEENRRKQEEIDRAYNEALMVKPLYDRIIELEKLVKTLTPTSTTN